jgi:hypothetical protein
MAKRSPLRTAQADSVSVCGRLLKKGQSLTVAKSAIGPREQKLISRGKVTLRKSNKPGFVQVVCTL